MKKKIVSWLTILAFAMTMLPVLPNTAEAEPFENAVSDREESGVVACIISGYSTKEYESMASAIEALHAGDTLKLMDDYSAEAISGDNGVLKITQAEVTLDLNGHSITGTGEDESGAVIYVSVVGSGTFTLENSAEGTTSTIQGPVPINVNGGNDSGFVDVKVEGLGTIICESTSKNGPIVLEGNARLPYSEAAATMVHNGGFGAIVDDVQYIYTSAEEALTASDDNSATLLNDYTGEAVLTVPEPQNNNDNVFYLNLGGHTYKQTDADQPALLLSANNDLPYGTVLYFENGALSSAGNGIEYPDGGITLNMENVDINAEGLYGIYVDDSNLDDSNLDGSWIGMNVETSTIQVPNGIGIYWPNGSGGIENTDITAHTGIQICGGVFSIDFFSIDDPIPPSTITATGAWEEKTDIGGGILDGAALSIIDREGYPEISSLGVHAATFIAAEGNQAVKAYTYNDTTKEVSGFVNNEDIGNNVMVSSGRFSTLVPNDLLTMNVEREIYRPDNSVTPYIYYQFKEEAEAAIEPNDIVVDTLTGDIDPYNRFNVTFNYGEGKTVVASVSEGATMYAPTPSKENYTFLGWSDGTTLYKIGEGIKVTNEMTLTAQWEDASASEPDTPDTPSTPSEPTTPSEPEQPSIDVSTDEDAAITTAKPDITTSGTTASATVSEAMGEAIVEQATENESNTVVIAPEMDNDITEAEVVVPADTVEALGNDTDADLVIDTPVGKVTLPNSELSALAKDTDDITVSLKADDDTVEFVIADDAGAVATVNGGVKLVVPADTKAGTVAVIVNADGTREVVRKSVASDDNMIIPLDGSATIEIVNNSKDFVDVAENSWYSDAVAFASSHELFNGTSTTEFSPDAGMTRGMIAAVLSNLERGDGSGLDAAFNDVADDAWYAEAIAWAAENGIVNGLGNGMFGPEELITREQMAAMLYNYADMLGVDTSARANLNAYSDADSVSSWANEVMSWANATGIINGTTTTTLDPQGTATRAQVAAMLERFVLLIAE